MLVTQIDKIGVISYTGDVFTVKVGSGEIPTLSDFNLIIEQLESEVNEKVSKLPNFLDWSISERNYVTIKEQFIGLPLNISGTYKEGDWMGKYAHLFHEPMTSREARHVFFSKVTKENREELFEDYNNYVTPVRRKELEYACAHPELILY